MWGKGRPHDARRRADRLCALMAGLAGALLASCATVPPEDISTRDAAAQAAPLFVLPYRVDYRGLPVAPVRVNDEGPFDFIVDVAATKSGVFERLRKRLDTPADSSSVQVFGIAGAATRPSVAVETIDLAGWRAGPLDVVALDDWPAAARTPDGVLGLDILDRFFLLVEPQSQTIAFYAPDTPLPERVRPWARALMTAETFGLTQTPLYLLTARIGLQRFPLLIDTGLEATIGNEALVHLLPTAPPTPAIRADARIVGSTEGETRSRRLFFFGLTTGDIRWRDDGMHIADARIFADLGYADRPFAIIGFDLLGGRPFAVDFRNRLFYAGPDPLDSG